MLMSKYFTCIPAYRGAVSHGLCPRLSFSLFPCLQTETCGFSAIFGWVALCVCHRGCDPAHSHMWNLHGSCMPGRCSASKTTDRTCRQTRAMEQRDVYVSGGRLLGRLVAIGKLIETVFSNLIMRSWIKDVKKKKTEQFCDTCANLYRMQHSITHSA